MENQQYDLALVEIEEGEKKFDETGEMFNLRGCASANFTILTLQLQPMRTGFDLIPKITRSILIWQFALSNWNKSNRRYITWNNVSV